MKLQPPWIGYSLLLSTVVIVGFCIVVQIPSILNGDLIALAWISLAIALLEHLLSNTHDEVEELRFN